MTERMNEWQVLLLATYECGDVFVLEICSAALKGHSKNNTHVRIRVL